MAPESQIVPIAKHAWCGLKTFAGQVVAEANAGLHNMPLRPQSDPMSDVRLISQRPSACFAVLPNGFAQQVAPPGGVVVASHARGQQQPSATAPATGGQQQRPFPALIPQQLPAGTQAAAVANPYYASGSMPIAAANCATQHAWMAPPSAAAAAAGFVVMQPVPAHTLQAGVAPYHQVKSGSTQERNGEK